MSSSVGTTKNTILLRAACTARHAYTLNNPRYWRASCTRRRGDEPTTDCDCTETGIDVTKDQMGIQRIREAAEMAKIE
jgi:hypothetical protein